MDLAKPHSGNGAERLSSSNPRNDELLIFRPIAIIINYPLLSSTILDLWKRVNACLKWKYIYIERKFGRIFIKRKDREYFTLVRSFIFFDENFFSRFDSG